MSETQQDRTTTTKKENKLPLGLLLIGVQLLILGGVLGWLLHDRTTDDDPADAPQRSAVAIQSDANDTILAQMVADALEETPPPAAGIRDQAIVFISASDGTHPAQVTYGQGADVGTAAESALYAMQELWNSTPPPQWIMVDVVEEVTVLVSYDLTTPLPFDPSLAGFALDWGAGLAFLPQETLANTLIDEDGVLQMGSLAWYANRRLVHAERLQDLTGDEVATVYAFTTRSVFTDGDTVMPLYRGHQMYDDVTASDLRYAARLGGEYMADAVDENGKFVYAYFPTSDQVTTGYNIVRHAGTLYAMAELYRATGDPELGAAVERALGYLMRATKPCPGPNTSIPTRCVVENDQVKLGSNALAIVALVEYMTVTGDETYLPEMLELAAWIKDAQQPDGSMVHKVVMSTGAVTAFESQYYPGEAILGMTRLHQYTGDEQWLDIAEDAAKYLILVRDAGLETRELNHDHWLLYGLNDLYRERPDPIYMEHTIRITDAILMLQRQENPPYPDWLGSYYNPPRSTPTATRSEGMCAAYKLLREYGEDEQADRILTALKLGVRFQLQTQFRPPSAMYLPDPQRVQGGFHASLTDFTIRNDYVQHNVSALLCVADQLEQ